MKQGSAKHKYFMANLQVGDPVILKGKYRHENEKGKIRKVERIDKDGLFRVNCYEANADDGFWRGTLLGNWPFRKNGTFDPLPNTSGYYLHPPKCKECPTKPPIVWIRETLHERTSDCAERQGTIPCPFTPAFIPPPRCELHPIEPSMLPPEGLNLKVGDWVEMYCGAITQLKAETRDYQGSFVLRTHDDGINFKRNGYYTGDNSPNPNNVRRLIPEFEAPPYLEWLESIKDGKPFNCRVIKTDKWHEPYNAPIDVIAIGEFRDGEFIVSVPVECRYIDGYIAHDTRFNDAGTWSNMWRIVLIGTKE